MDLKLIVDNENKDSNTYSDSLIACEFVKSREYQIENFIDETRPAQIKFFDLMNSYKNKYENLEKFDDEMVELTVEDKNYFDPYIQLLDSLNYLIDVIEDKEVVKDLIQKRFAYILDIYNLICNLICDKDGNYPEKMDWYIQENRHIIRALDEIAKFCWKENYKDFALHLYRKLLKTNLEDNLGLRYNILALRFNLDFNYLDEFSFTEGDFVGIESDRLDDWFDQNKQTYFEEFVEYNEYINSIEE